jgi:hypothetical protein
MPLRHIAHAPTHTHDHWMRPYLTRPLTCASIPHARARSSRLQTAAFAAEDDDEAAYFEEMAMQFQHWCGWKVDIGTHHPFRRAVFLRSARIITVLTALALTVLWVLAFPDRKNTDVPSMKVSSSFTLYFCVQGV